MVLSSEFAQSHYVAEEVTSVFPCKSLQNVDLLPKSEGNSLGIVTIYNPDKWKYATYTFYEKKPVHLNKSVFEILHLSFGN